MKWFFESLRLWNFGEIWKFETLNFETCTLWNLFIPTKGIPHPTEFWLPPLHDIIHKWKLRIPPPLHSKSKYERIHKWCFFQLENKWKYVKCENVSFTGSGTQLINLVIKWWFRKSRSVVSRWKNIEYRSVLLHKRQSTTYENSPTITISYMMLWCWSDHKSEKLSNMRAHTYIYNMQVFCFTSTQTQLIRVVIKRRFHKWCPSVN